MSEAHDGAAAAAPEDTTAADLAVDAAEAHEEPAEPGDDAAAEAGEGEGAKPKPKKTVQDRIDELTRDKHAERQRAEALERELQRLKGERKPEAEQPREDAEPDPADYQYGETDPSYIKELGRWTARQEFAKLSQEAERKTRARTVAESWDQRQQAFAKDKPDYAEKVYRGPEWDCSPAMADAIKTSDAGPAVAYHLASNPDEARRIAGLNPLAAIREIGRLEARLEPQAKPQPKTASDAPTPPPQLRGQGGQFKAAPDTDDFTAFEKAYGN